MKLVWMMKFQNQTVEDWLTLQSDGTRTLKWYVDAASAVHPDFKSHTGGILTMGKGAITSTSQKQGLNTRSSTKAKIIAADDMAGPMVWTQILLEKQGYHLEDNILYQDNQSVMLLISNGHRSAGRWSQHLNIWLFFVMLDQKEKWHISIRFCSTDLMIGNYMTKSLHCWKFTQFQQEIMNLLIAARLIMWHCILLPNW